MRKSLLFALAAVLAMFTPALAADPPQTDSGKMTVHKDDNASAGPALPTNPDGEGPDGQGTAKVILLDPDGIKTMPNPYANPGPRLISDAWAMRT